MGQAEKIFRQHDVAPTVRSSDLYRQLTAEWVRVNALPATLADVRRWARSEPVLAFTDRPADVVDTIDAGDYARKDALVLALVRLGQRGDHLAQHTLLHAMLPGLAGLAARSTAKMPDDGGDRAESARQLVVEEFFDVAAEYPVIRRRTRVALNLLLDTRKRVYALLCEAEPMPFDPIAAYGDVAPYGDFGTYRAVRAQAAHDAPSFVDGIDPDADLLTVLTWAVRESVITAADAQMLADVYLPATTDGWGFDDVAHAQGLSRDAVKMRCSRAVAKLASAARSEVASNGRPCTRQGPGA